jgi:16S rRNA (uracil1498-N3)-methyltransferase
VKPAPRVYVKEDLQEGALLGLDGAIGHHLTQVLRLTEGAELRVFNGRDGEFAARLAGVEKKSAKAAVGAQTRVQTPANQPTLMFAPVKRQATDWIVEKATELGAGVIAPVLTRRTISETVRLERWRAIAQEASEQCERLDLPEIRTPRSLGAAFDGWDAATHLIFADEACDDDSPAPPAADAIHALPQNARMAVLIGPEGGFDPGERRHLRSLPFVQPISLGPRILRAETAAVALLSVAQAIRGDWRL